jgi:hypothetical protein
VSALDNELPPSAERPEWAASELRRVVVRLTNGDVVQAGTATNLDGARALARSIVAEIEHPAGDWPRIGDRLIRPDAVVSVDVVRLDA